MRGVEVLTFVAARVCAFLSRDELGRWSLAAVGEGPSGINITGNILAAAIPAVVLKAAILR